MKISLRKKMPLVMLLAVAAASAVLFSKRAPLPIDGEAPSGADRPALARRLTTPATQAQHILASHDESHLKVPTAATAALDSQAGMEFSASYGRSFSPASALFGPSSAWTDRRESARSPAGPELEAQAAEPIRHVVADGDTLTKLAARYLGSSERYLEIFHANRGVLANPDLLPIGAVLEIPAVENPTLEIPAARPTGIVPIPEQEIDRETSRELPSITPTPRLVPVPRELLGGSDS